jgi:hypothetical protein
MRFEADWHPGTPELANQREAPATARFGMRIEPISSKGLYDTKRKAIALNGFTL